MKFNSLLSRYQRGTRSYKLLPVPTARTQKNPPKRASFYGNNGSFILRFRSRSGYEINLSQRQAVEVALGDTSISRLWPAQRLELYGHNRTANNGSVGC